MLFMSFSESLQPDLRATLAAIVCKVGSHWLISRQDSKGDQSDVIGVLTANRMAHFSTIKVINWLSDVICGTIIGHHKVGP